MIHTAAEKLEDLGFTIVEQVRDDYGTIGYVLRFVGTDYCLVAKEYAHEDLASFMARLVLHAPDEMRFIFYCYEDVSYTVFDGEYIREHANPSQGASKQRDCSWLELPRSCGADLDEYIRGKAKPATLAGDNRTLGDYE